MVSVATDVIVIRNADDTATYPSPVPDLATLLNNPIRVSSSTTQFVEAVGIDLSDLGIAEGASVTSFGVSGGGSDPVIVTALPIPEAAAALLGTIGALALLRRRC